ncbi:MAG: hypothetical protein HUK07_01010 [Bacteroidaceae bacterium]|nr:hypothetical protein [Bacteroidaceae bacterium]
MNTTTYSEFTVRVPRGKETTLFRNLVERMGWQTTAHRAKAVVVSNDIPNATTIKAMEDARAGRVFKASSVADLLAQLDA